MSTSLFPQTTNYSYHYLPSISFPSILSSHRFVSPLQSAFFPKGHFSKVKLYCNNNNLLVYNLASCFLSHMDQSLTQHTWGQGLHSHIHHRANTDWLAIFLTHIHGYGQETRPHWLLAITEYTERPRNQTWILLAIVLTALTTKAPRIQ